MNSIDPIPSMIYSQYGVFYDDYRLDMMKLKITKIFLDNYRQYKIDRVEDITPVDILYTALEHLLNNGRTLSYMYDLLSGDYSFYIDVITGDVSERVRNGSSKAMNLTKNQHFMNNIKNK